MLSIHLSTPSIWSASRYPWLFSVKLCKIQADERDLGRSKLVKFVEHERIDVAKIDPVPIVLVSKRNIEKGAAIH